MHRRVYLLVAGLLVLSLVGATSVSGQRILSDISDNWAKEHIESLVSQGIVSGYPDGTFRPDRPVTRAEFAKLMTRAFDVESRQEVSFRDIEGHWAQEPILKLARAGIVNGYPDDTFRPGDDITRAEATSMIVRVLKLHDVKGFSEVDSFADLPAGHWARESAEVALRLKLLPPYVRGEFQPNRPATRAEVAAMIREATRLRVTRGTVDYLEPQTRILGVRNDRGVADFELGADTVLFRNTVVAPFDNFVLGDDVYVVSDRFGSPQFVKANGKITRNDVATKVSDITRGLLTPSDLKAIIAGDWDALAQSLKSTLYDQLIARGATPVEAAAIMSQDWESLEYYGRERLAQAIGSHLGITTDLAIALLDRDWGKAKELAQLEAVEQLLGQFLIPEGA